MRYYTIYLPDREGEDPIITTNVRVLKNLPDETRVYVNITENDGSLIDQVRLPVKDGRVVFRGDNGKSEAKHHARLI